MDKPVNSPEPFEVNFCFPVRELENERIKLTPYTPSIHTPPFFTLSSPHPELYTHLPWGPFPSVPDIDDYFAGRFHPNPAHVLFAIIDKTRNDELHVDKDGAFAGIIGFLNTSVQNLSTEIGAIIIIPSFQRTHVTSNAVGLLLQYALDLPQDGGLGLRRVQWQTNAGNDVSIGTAERMGFRKEGLLRWDRVLHGGWEKGKAGNGRITPQRGLADQHKGVEGRGKDIGRDTVMLSLCWDDWEEGGREKVKGLMERRLIK